MALTATLRPPNPRRRSTDPPVAAATANDGDLPLDVLYEILLRLPPKPLCRFRAVCRSWRSLLSHPEFIAAIGNPGLLLAIGVKDYSLSNKVHVLDVESGDVVKDVNLAANSVDFLYGETRAMSDDDRVACVVDPQDRFRLIDLANGTVSLLPPPLASSSTSTSGIVGYATSTGEHKVLAMATSMNTHHHEQQVCKIFTLGLGNGGWRDTGSPPLTVWSSSRGIAVIDGVAYFESLYFPSRDRHAHRIMAFDLNNEAWSSLQGPTNCYDVCLTKWQKKDL